jgi:hypothetical protein
MSSKQVLFYHGSGFKHNTLKPGIDHTGDKVEWDKTESNEFLYVDETREEAISMAFASAMEKKYKVNRYQTEGEKITIKLAKGEKKIDKDDLEKLKIYIYTISKDDGDEWSKVNNKHNNSTTEWKTKKHISDNIVDVKEVNLSTWLKDKQVKISNESLLLSFDW